VPTIRCKVVTEGVRCESVIQTAESVSENAGFICRNHPRSVQVKAAKRAYDPILDEADKNIHFQDVAWDPDLGGKVEPLFRGDELGDGKRKSPVFYE
jgi:hypothetical protein